MKTNYGWKIATLIFAMLTVVMTVTWIEQRKDDQALQNLLVDLYTHLNKLDELQDKNIAALDIILQKFENLRLMSMFTAEDLKLLLEDMDGRKK